MIHASKRFSWPRRSILLAVALAFALTAFSAAAPAKGKAKGAAKGAAKAAVASQSASQSASRPAKKYPNTPTGPLKPTTEQLVPADTLAKDKTGTLLVLHTNDIHDIIKDPAGNTLGGMAYLAGYDESVRAKRPDTLILNAGDMLQKGDKMSVVSKGEAAYLALGAIGCDCTVPGNHDFFYGMDALRRNAKVSGVPMICASVVYEDTGEPAFPETLIKQVGDVKVGLIGATVPRGGIVENGRKIRTMDMTEAGKRVGELARKMDPEVDLTIVVYHAGLGPGLTVAGMAPTVDVVVCGHANEVTEKPEKAKTGALVVEVGRAGQWVGSLDMVVDKTQKK
ncbi:MAG: metallophosphoesterase, partial [Candidatus Sumerlaeota bacterium]|nr:metallophosphoesterase [Candidatus Sumerlaeota bacterium]